MKLPSAGMFFAYGFVLLFAPSQTWAAETKKSVEFTGNFGEARVGPEREGLLQLDVAPSVADAVRDQFVSQPLDMAAPAEGLAGIPVTRLQGTATATLGAALNVSEVAEKAKRGEAAPTAVDGENRAAFDGGLAAANSPEAVDLGGRGNDGSGNGNGGFGGGSNGPTGPSDSGGGPAAPFTPRLTFIEDLFVQQADETTISYIEKLLDTPGSHVVFLTSRTKEEAESALLEKLRGRRNNALVVVSENGVRIFMDGKKTPSDEYGALSEHDLNRLTAIDAAIRKSLKIQEPAPEVEVGETPLYFYRWALPASVPDDQAPAKMAQAVANFNQVFKSARLSFEAELDRNDPRAIRIHPMQMHMVLPRLKTVLQHEFPNEFTDEQALMEKSAKFYILVRSPLLGRALAATFPAADIVPVSNEADVRQALAAALDKKTMPVVKWRLASLRSYLWWERSKRYAASDINAPEEGSAGTPSTTGDSVDKALSAYVGSIIQTHLSWAWMKLKTGNSKVLGRTQLLEKLEQLWFVPSQRDHVFISPDVASAKRTEDWHERQSGFLAYAKAWFNHYYDRELADITVAAADARANLLSLASYFTRGELELVSRISGRIFKIYVNVKRVMLRDTADGTVLTAYEYRTGRENEEADKVQAQAWAIFILQRQGRLGQDGKWHHMSPDGPPLSRIDIQFEYFRRHRVWSFKPEDLLVTRNGRVEFGPVASEITNLAARADADQEFKQRDKAQYEAQKALEAAEKAHAESEQANKEPKAKRPKKKSDAAARRKA